MAIGDISSKPVPRVGGLSRAEFISDYLNRHEPFIITDEAASWPAVDKWSLDYLARSHHDHEVLVEYYPRGNRNHAYTYVRMTVAEYIRRVTEDPTARRRYYIADVTLESTLPHVARDVEIPSIIENRASLRPALFLGCDTFSNAHYHRFTSQVLLTQIVGCKEVTLYPAAHTKHTYPHPWYALRPNFSQIEMEASDGEELRKQYPKLQSAEAWHCVVEPGEMLFIPDHWMHVVRGPGENVTVSYFWDEAWRYAYLPGLLRDYSSLISKTAMVQVARVSKHLDFHQKMLELAVRLGVVPADEKDAVLQHLDEFEGRLPAIVNAEQANEKLAT